MAEQNRDELQPQGTTSPAKGPSQGEMNGAGPEATELIVNGHAGENIPATDHAAPADDDQRGEERGGEDKMPDKVESAAAGVSSHGISEAGQEKTVMQRAVLDAGSSLNSSECTSLLRGICDTLKESVSATNSMRRTTEKGFSDFQELASRLVERVELTNSLLKNLINKITVRSISEDSVEATKQNEEVSPEPETDNQGSKEYLNAENLKLSVKGHPESCETEIALSKTNKGSVYLDNETDQNTRYLKGVIMDPMNRPAAVDTSHSSQDLYSSEEEVDRECETLTPAINADPSNFSEDVASGLPKTEDQTFPDEDDTSSSPSCEDQPSEVRLDAGDENKVAPNAPPDTMENPRHNSQEKPPERSHQKWKATEKTPEKEKAREKPPGTEKGIVASSSSSQNNRSQSEPPKDARPKETHTTVGSVHMPEPRLHQGRTGRRSGNRDQSGISELGLSIFSSGETESRRLHEALERARAPDPDPAPKARSFDTVLCLDTSESMSKGGAFEQMKKAAMAFVDGVEDVVNDTGVEENIGIVMFGGYSNIVQHLTNDFARVREKIESMETGGKSPFFEAMVVCLAAFDGRGGTVSVSGEYDVHPRIIFITDGHITECSSDPYGPDRVHDATNTRAGFSRLMMDLSPKTNSSIPHPILFVPVGSRADRSFLESMAKLNDSHLVEPEEITTLCNYFTVQETIGKVIVCLHNKETDSSDGEIEAVVKALVPDINSQEMTEVLTTVRKELKEPTRQKSQRTKPTDFDDVFEDTEGVQRGERLPLGTRVLRGPDWSWGEQDGRGAGTVVQHESKRHPFTWVLWDTGEWNRYPFGSQMGYHVWATDKHPVLKSENGELEIGMIVRKGSKWNQSPRDSILGVVIRKSRRNRKVKVRWDSGEITACPDDAVELNTSKSGFSGSRETESETTRVSPIPEENFQSDEEEDESKVRAWQWRDDWGNWHLYSEHQNEQLEKSYQRKKTGTCIIQRDGKAFRVLFGRKVERDLSKKLERDIQRVLLSPDDYASFLKAEELVPSESMR